MATFTEFPLGRIKLFLEVLSMFGFTVNGCPLAFTPPSGCPSSASSPRAVTIKAAVILLAAIAPSVGAHRVLGPDIKVDTRSGSAARTQPIIRPRFAHFASTSAVMLIKQPGGRS